MTQLGVSADSGAYLNSGYWGSFTIGRFLGIFVSLYFTPQQMVVADLLGCIVAVIIIMLFQSSFTALWLGTVIYGVSVGSVYASAINYTERLVGVSGRLLSYLTFFAALGDAVVPLTIGSVFDTSIGGRGMMWVVVMVAATATSTFAYLWWWVERSQQQHVRANELAKDGSEQQKDGQSALELSEVVSQSGVGADGEDGRLDGSREDVERPHRPPQSSSSSDKGMRIGASRRKKMGYAELPAQVHSGAGADNQHQQVDEQRLTDEEL